MIENPYDYPMRRFWFSRFSTWKPVWKSTDEWMRTTLVIGTPLTGSIVIAGRQHPGAYLYEQSNGEKEWRCECDEWFISHLVGDYLVQSNYEDFQKTNFWALRKFK